MAAKVTTAPIDSFYNILKQLGSELPEGAVKQREGWRDRNGNTHMVDYVEWHTVADILDDTAPEWSQAVKDIRQIGNVIAVTVAITIGGITREGIGTGAADTELGIKKAEHDALKRAAVKFGVARELYKKETEAIERGGSYSGGSDNSGGFPANPIASSLSDLVTAKQLGMIRALARELGLEPDEECTAVMNCKTDELSRKAGSALIQHLQDLQKANSDHEAKMPMRRTEGASTGNGSGSIREPNAPASDKQINAIEKMAMKSGDNFHDLADRFTEGRSNSLNDLTKQEASNCIEYLNAQLESR